VVEDGKKILSNVVATQIPFHAAYNGVVPEIASRL
jgi:N6-L-threonylcarbamoyladenine synthase